MGGERAIRDDGDVDTSVIVDYERRRRDVVRRGLLTGAGALSATAVPLLLSVRDAFAAGLSNDASVLTSAIGIEQVAEFSYDLAATGRLLSRPLAALARRLAMHEREHAAALTTALTALAGSAPARPVSVGDVDRAVRELKITPGLSQVRTQAEFVTYAIELELAAVGAYRDAHRTLQNSALMMTATQIMCSEGQHLVMLREAARRDPVPNAFETGTPG